MSREFIQLGDQGDAVKVLQEYLVKLKLVDPDGVDGDFGEITNESVRKFQTLNNLEVTGVVERLTWEKLEEEKALPTLSDVQSRMEAIIQTVIKACNSPDKGQSPPENIRKYLPIIMQALAERGLISKNQLAGVVATIYVELGDWVPREEDDGSVAISHPSGGDQYRGRSFFQITHIENYTSAGKALELDLVNNPEQLLDPLTGARTSILYWVGWLNNTSVAPFAESGDYRNVRSCVNAGSPGKWDICYGQDAFEFAWNILVSELPEGATPDLVGIPLSIPAIAKTTSTPSQPIKWTLDNIVQGISIIPNGSFTWTEATKGGSRMPPDQQTLDSMIKIATLAQKAREIVGRPFFVTSWYRNPVVNAEVGGVPDSRHINGDAIDFYCDNMTGEEIYNLLDPIWEGGLGKYIRFPFLCHIDARNYRARWTN